MLAARLGHTDWIKVLAEAIAVNGSVTCVDVRYNDIDGDVASQLSAAVLANTKIEVFNEIPIKEMRADSIRELDLKGKSIGVVGGMVVACLVPVMSSITQVIAFIMTSLTCPSLTCIPCLFCSLICQGTHCAEYGK